MTDIRNNWKVSTGIGICLLVIAYLLFETKKSTKPQSNQITNKLALMYLQEAREHVMAQQPEAAIVSIRTACKKGISNPMLLLQDSLIYMLVKDSSTRPAIRALMEQYAEYPEATSYLQGEPRTPIIVRGIVENSADKTPVEGAKVILTHADHKGYYFTEKTKWNPRLFAVVMTDSLGHFTLRAIAPGRYKDGNGNWVASHIHYTITASNYTPIGSEFTFDNDSIFKANGNVDQVAVAFLKPKKANTSITFDVTLSINPM